MTRAIRQSGWEDQFAEPTSNKTTQCSTGKVQTQKSNYVIARYTYCFCQRSPNTRLPGTWCGPRGESCGSQGDFVDGLNNLIEGAQGDVATLIANKTLNGVVDEDVDGVCDDTLYYKLRYMFKPEPTVEF